MIVTGTLSEISVRGSAKLGAVTLSIDDDTGTQFKELYLNHEASAVSCNGVAVRSVQDLLAWYLAHPKARVQLYQWPNGVSVRASFSDEVKDGESD